MNVVNLGVLAGQDIGDTMLLIVVLLSLLGAGLLMLLALADASSRAGAAGKRKLVPVTLPRAVRPDGMQRLHPNELAGQGGASRAPPRFPRHEQASLLADIEADLRRFDDRR